MGKIKTTLMDKGALFMQKNPYINNGVVSYPTTPVFGKKVTISYNGLLSNSGAQDVYAHVGFGNTWRDSCDYKMARTDDGFEATIPVTWADELNVCFKDNSNNWDNNNGQNYKFTVLD